MQAVGVVDPDYKPKWYSPQQWLNSPDQVDRFHLRVVDTTMLEVVQKLTKREVVEPEVPQPGDLMLCKIIESWTHAAIIIKWPDLVLHPVKGKGVMGSHALKEGWWCNMPKRFFSVIEIDEEVK